VELQTFVKWSPEIATLMEGSVERDILEALDGLIAAGETEMLSHLMLTGTEISVRRMTDALIEREVFEPLVAGACLRREVKRTAPMGASALGSRAIFRDFEAPEEGEAAIPEHIIEEADAISQAADQSRRIADRHKARLDRDPVRQHIVERLGELLNTSEPAMEAMIAIARASVWEETARAAAMKLGSNNIVLGRVSRAGRVDDMIAVGDAAGSQAARQMIARSLAESMPAAAHPSYRVALEYVSEHHPSESHRLAARQALGG